MRKILILVMIILCVACDDSVSYIAGTYINSESGRKYVFTDNSVEYWGKEQSNYRMVYKGTYKTSSTSTNTVISCHFTTEWKYNTTTGELTQQSGSGLYGMNITEGFIDREFSSDGMWYGEDFYKRQ